MQLQLQGLKEKQMQHMNTEAVFRKEKCLPNLQLSLSQDSETKHHQEAKKDIIDTKLSLSLSPTLSRQVSKYSSEDQQNGMSTLHDVNRLELDLQKNRSKAKLGLSTWDLTMSY